MLTASIIILLLTVLVTLDDVDPRDRDDPILKAIPVQPVPSQLQSRFRQP